MPLLEKMQICVVSVPDIHYTVHVYGHKLDSHSGLGICSLVFVRIAIIAILKNVSRSRCLFSKRAIRSHKTAKVKKCDINF